MKQSQYNQVPSVYGHPKVRTWYLCLPLGKLYTPVAGGYVGFTFSWELFAVESFMAAKCSTQHPGDPVCCLLGWSLY